MRKNFFILIIAILLLMGSVIGFKLATQKNDSGSAGEPQNHSIKTELFTNHKTGLEFSLPEGYKEVKIASPKSSTNQDSSIIMQLEKSNPQSFVIVQHDTGLSGPAALLHQSTLEYVETTIRQYYPVRYGSSYKSESLERTRVNEHDAVEHIYTYIDKDGRPNKVRLLTIIWSGDETYNIILQSSEVNFEAIKNDINNVKDTFNINETPSKK